MSPIPVNAKPETVHVHADPRLAFQVLTAFGAAMPGSEGSSKVLSEDEGHLLVEFHTPVKGLLGRTKVYRTVEWVTRHEPEAVDFEGVEGPLTLLRDRITVEAQGNCALLRYESQFGLKWGVAGWLLARLLVRPVMQRFIQTHLSELKEAIEAHAARSKVYPHVPCTTV